MTLESKPAIQLGFLWVSHLWSLQDRWKSINICPESVFKVRLDKSSVLLLNIRLMAQNPVRWQKSLPFPAKSQCVVPLNPPFPIWMYLVISSALGCSQKPSLLRDSVGFAPSSHIFPDKELLAFPQSFIPAGKQSLENPNGLMVYLARK